MTPVLIDTSVWIDFFRGQRAVVERVAPLLKGGSAALCGPVLAEVLSGTVDRQTFHRLGRQLRALVQVPEPDDIWELVAEARFALARQGFQAHLVDLNIALTSVKGGARLLTRDRDFRAIGRVVPVDLELF